MNPRQQAKPEWDEGVRYMRDARGRYLLMLDETQRVQRVYVDEAIERLIASTKPREPNR